MSKKSKEFFKNEETGWEKLIGEVQINSASVLEAEKEAKAQKTKPKYFARFFPPMSAIAQTLERNIDKEKKYEVGFRVATDSSTGFLAATVTFLNEAGTPIGCPSSTGVKLSNLEPGTYTDVTFETGPAPDGAVKAQLIFTALGTSPEKVVDIEEVYFK